MYRLGLIQGIRIGSAKVNQCTWTTHGPCSSFTLHQIPLVPYDPGIEATGPRERSASALPHVKKQESAECAWEHWESVSTSEHHGKLSAAGRGQRGHER